MANQLTGGFDVVAEFSVAAINRVLAAMHRGNRFPHSLSVRVDDTPHSRGSLPVVDLSGSAMTDRATVARTGTPPGRNGLSSANAVANMLSRLVLDPLVNSGANDPGDGFSLLKGVAQVQLGAPTLTLPSSTIANATVHMPAMVRYFPDPNTTVLPEYLHGEIQTTFGAKEVSSQAGTFIHVDLAGTGGDINFQQLPSPSLSSSQLTAINAALRNALVTGFQPSNTPLPSNVVNMQFWPLPNPGAIAVLMNLPGGQPPPGELYSWNSVFLGAQDQFAIAVSADYVIASITPAISQAIAPYQDQRVSETVNIGYLFGTYSFHVFAHITVGTPTVQFQAGQILLSIPAHVSISSDSSIGPSRAFDLKITQAFTLSLSGGQVSIQLLGALNVDISSSVWGDMADAIYGGIRDRIRSNAQAVFANAWANASDQIQQAVGGMLSVTSLQGFLAKLMNPVVQQQTGAPPQPVNPTLSYTSFEIRTAGVVLHGALAVPAWPAPDVEFDLDSTSIQHPEYNALNSWIPGGSIQNYVWSFAGSAQPPDSEKFVSSNAPQLSIVAELRSVCLTIHGTRVSASGAVANESVSMQFCKGLSTTLAANSPQAGGSGSPDVGLTQMVGGALQMQGHTSPWAPAGVSAGGTANLVVYFPDDASLANLDFLTKALKESGRTDTATGIVCVVSPEQLSKAKPTANVSFADDQAGWARLFQVEKRPATIVLGTAGQVVFQQQGGIGASDLAQALKKHLSPHGYLMPQFLESSVKIGRRAPNFVFEYAPGRQITLRKLTNGSVALVFCKGASEPSLIALRNLHQAFSQPGAQPPVLLAIAGDEDLEFAKGLATANGLSAIVVPDSRGQISAAYGVSVWPTVIFLDGSGVVKDIWYGLFTEQQTKLSGTLNGKVASR